MCNICGIQHTLRSKLIWIHAWDRQHWARALTILNKSLRAGEPSMCSCHVQGSLPIFTLKREKAEKETFIIAKCTYYKYEIIKTSAIQLWVQLRSVRKIKWTEAITDATVDHPHTQNAWAACCLRESPSPSIIHMALHLVAVGTQYQFPSLLPKC